MRGAAMKVGQMLSMVEFDGLDEEQQDELQRKLATLRDGVPPVPFARLEKLLRKELGAPLGDVFADFDERAFAAASIGQVHRATTLDGDDVVVKVQYPGVAEAVETDLRNAMLLLPLVKRLAPGLDAKALATEMRERIGEELDYELEAQNQRRIERLVRGHPFISVPRVHTDLSTRACWSPSTSRGRASRPSAAPTRPRATATARSSSASSSACSIATGSRSATRIRATTCCAPTGGVCFLDFGLLRDIDRDHVAAEVAIAHRGPREGCRGAEGGAGRGRLPPARPRRRGRRRARAAADAPRDPVVRGPRRAPLLDRAWPARPQRRPARRRAAGRDQDQINQFTLPPSRS